MQQTVEEQVVDLCHVAIHLQPQVVDHRVVLAVLQVAVDVESGVPLTLNASANAGQFFVQPLLLPGIQQG